MSKKAKRFIVDFLTCAIPFTVAYFWDDAVTAFLITFPIYLFILRPLFNRFIDSEIK